jgi:hypothetical protein
MFSIEQRRSDFLQIKNTKSSTQSSYPQRHCEIRDGEGLHQELNDGSRLIDESASSALGVMRKKKSMYSFDASCFNEAPSFSGTSSIGESSESSLEGDYGITRVNPTSHLPVSQNRSFVDDMNLLIPDGATCLSNDNESQTHRQLNLSNAMARKVMEPHLRRARLLREQSRGPNSHGNISASIASSMGVPYTPLRRECPFLFDVSTYPLHAVLAQTLGTNDLSQIHLESRNGDVLLPLLDKRNRKSFHSVYDTFVTSFCIPLIHSMAISKGVIQQSTSDRVHYRYQAFPNIHIARPGETVFTDPTCDSILGYSVGCLTFYIPLTPCGGSSNNCLLVESHPGREDWHALGTKSIGLGYLFDGSRCLHFDVANSSASTRVALMFRVLIYRDDGNLNPTNSTSATGLCPRNLLADAFSQKEENSAFYDEAYIDLRSAHAVVKKQGSRLLDPSPHLGYPFA